MGQTSGRAFSLGWVLVSYFLVAGCILLIMLGFVLGKVQGEWTGYAAFGGGAFIGGFFAGRASPHYSIIESTLAGLLVVGSIVLLIMLSPFATVFGADSEAITNALILGVVAMGGGFVGGWLGEKSSESREPVRGFPRWIGINTLMNFGTLWTALIVLSIFMMRDTAQGRMLDLESVMSMGLAAAAVAAFSAGLFTQAVAPARVLFAAVGGAFLAYAGIMGLALVGQRGAASADFSTGAGIIVVGAVIVSLIGALLGWLIVRNRVLANA